MIVDKVLWKYKIIVYKREYFKRQALMQLKMSLAESFRSKGKLGKSNKKGEDDSIKIDQLKLD